MTKFADESKNYLNNKKQVFDKLLTAIEVAQKENCSKIYVKEIKIMEETVDVIANDDEWPTILRKAMVFFENLEDYEMCQRCKNIEEKLSNLKKKNLNGKTTKRTKKT